METTYCKKLSSVCCSRNGGVFVSVLDNRINAFYSRRSMANFLTKNLVNDSFYFCISLFLIDC